MAPVNPLNRSSKGFNEGGELKGIRSPAFPIPFPWSDQANWIALFIKAEKKDLF